MYRHPSNIHFAPQKTSSLLISLKSEIYSHSPLFYHTRIPEVSSIKILGFLFDSLTWQKKHIDSVLCRGKQRLGQLYRYRSLLASQGIRPSLEYSAILYSGAAQSHLARLNSFQASV